MGFSASQARFLGLTARMANCEFQGQQINQQRTALANESSQAYTSLLNMKVPTPPSKTDYTKTVYGFTQGTFDFTIDTVLPSADGTYAVTYIKSGKNIGLVDSNLPATITKDTEPNKAESDIGGTPSGWIANGRKLYELDEHFSYENKNAAELFQQMFNNTPGVTMDMFYVYLSTDADQVTTCKFIKKEDIESIALSDNQSGLAHVWSQGTVNTSEKITAENANVVFDTDGRMTSVIIDDKIYQLEAKTVSDDVAYDDAYNQYEYEKYQYNQKVSEINADISIVQLQDKKLELQLEQLDTERSTITTEIEAVQKVLNDNIERTYKTFNG